MPLTRAEAHKILLSLDGATEGLHFGKPAIFVGEEFVTRIHHKEEAVVILTGSMDMRDVMLEAEPDRFYIIEHYRNRPALLARLSKLDRKTLKDLLAPRLLRINEKSAKKPSKKVVAKKAAKKKARSR
jgi:hypothetical protein